MINYLLISDFLVKIIRRFEKIVRDFNSCPTIRLAEIK